ncbi:hypothetical protein CDL12_11370 [Handroanthus impetiginosus]|uniref:Uncharacterized protein n=1 Tax=Handroanthus impetiginosus TaxID=429701 RepID=A0A2G9HEM1_9LAMI|nr:hypothetical protein CDL12_11370 [Handroanthus impetiginosus]
MVRFMLNGKVYGSFEEKAMGVMQMAVEESEEMEVEDAATASVGGDLAEKEQAAVDVKHPMVAEDVGLAGEYNKHGPVGVLKCMMNGIIYYPGMDKVIEAEAIREKGLAVQNTKIIEDYFDDFGRPRVKIVYVDIGDLTSSHRQKAEFQASNHIHTIIKDEKEREEREGRPRPRLIFVKQDRDYWPRSEKDPAVMDRRAAKELRASHFCPWIEPDEKLVWVPPTLEEEELVPPQSSDAEVQRAYELEYERRNFLRYLDPALPGTKFIFDNLSKIERDNAIIAYMEDLDLWEKWMRISEAAAMKDAIYSETAAVKDAMCSEDVMYNDHASAVTDAICSV